MAKTILIVDDHAINREFLITLLGYVGFHVVDASNAALALDIARRERPALVISDILMPGMDGIEFANRLHEDPAVADIPIIFYTATYRLHEAKALAQTCGVNFVLAKPAEPQAILDTVAAALQIDVDLKSQLPARASKTLLPDSAVLAPLPELEELQSRLRQALRDDAPSDFSRLPDLGKAHSLSLRLAALLELSLVLSSEHDLQQLINLFCRAAQDIMNVKYAAIHMGVHEQPMLFASHGMEQAEAETISEILKSLDKVSSSRFTQRKAMRPAEIPAKESDAGFDMSYLRWRDCLLVPIMLGDQACGWLYLADKLGIGLFNEEDEQFAITLAAQLAPIYENLILYEEVKEHAGRLELEGIERRRALTQLQESETRFRQLAENIHEIFFLSDPENTKVFYISPAYEEIWGQTCESLYANPLSWMDAVHPEDREVVRRGNEEKAVSGRFDYTYRIVRPDATVRWLRTRGYPIVDNDGKLIRIAGVVADITEQIQVQTLLQDREAGLRRAQLLAKLSHIITGPDGTFESWSETLPQLIGVDDNGMPPTTRKWLDIVHQADRERFRGTCIEAGRSGLRTEIDYRVWRADGALIDVHQVMEPLPGTATPDGKRRWFNTIQDVTEHNAQLQKIARLSRINAVLSAINSTIVRIHDRDELFQEACRIAVREGAFGMAWIGMINPDTLDGQVVAWAGGAVGYAEKIRLTARPGTPESNRPACIAVRESRVMVCNDIEAEVTLGPLRNELVERRHRAVAALPLIVEGHAAAVIVLFADEVGFFDEQELRLLNELAGDLSFALQFIGNREQLSYQAFYDPLTGLPNDRLFQDRLAQSLHANKPDHHVGVILINVNRFAQLNDALGRHAGDAVLKQIAQRLADSLHEPASAARIGSDTFAIALPGLSHGSETATVLQQEILNALDMPFRLNGQEIRITVRAGLAIHPVDGRDAEALFKHAEVALKNAKTSGKQYLYYAPEMNAAIATRLLLETELRSALEENQFEVYYQPRIDLMSGRIIGAEALIRWKHPRRGLVSPLEFVPLAEETGLIVPIGNWVIDAVCAQQAAWLLQSIDPVPVAINLSAVQFKSGKVTETIKEAIRKHGLEQSLVEFELTESVVMDNPDESAHHLNALKTLGLQLSLDDFGTGYSSLAYLKRFPFDFVKIDRSFIIDVTNNPGDAAIATAIIAMAHSLNLRVVAEGVETEGQLQFLRKLRCDEMQGYYFSPPVPADAFAAMLREDKHLLPMDEAEDGRNTLLIVDDEPFNLSSLNRLLRREGYRILTASSGQEGLDLLATHDVQVIIADQRMPKMSGSEFLSIVKELYPDTVRIILSGYTDLDAVTDSVNRGAVFKFLTKPWDDALLLENIRDAFRRYRPRQ